MTALDLFLALHARFHGASVAGGAYADQVLGDLTDDQMRVRPAQRLNSPAWLLWHIARTEDVVVNVVVVDGRQVFDDGWADRLGVTRRDIGTGMTEDEVEVMGRRLDVVAARAYRDAVGRRTREVAGALAPAAWDEALAAADVARAAAQGAFGPTAGWVPPLWQAQTRGLRLATAAVTHNAQHLAEALTVRSMAGFGGSR